MSDKTPAQNRPTHVHRVSDGGFHRIHAFFWTADQNFGGHDFYVSDLTSGGKGSHHARLDLHFAALALVELESKLAGNHLHDFQIVRLLDLMRTQIKSALSDRIHVTEIDFRVHVRGLQAMDQPL